MSRASALGSPSLDPKKTPVSTSALLVLVNSFAVLEQRRLTPWSTGLATACHAWAPFHSGPSASYRCVPVTANVSLSRIRLPTSRPMVALPAVIHSQVLPLVFGRSAGLRLLAGSVFKAFLAVTVRPHSASSSVFHCLRRLAGVVFHPAANPAVKLTRQRRAAYFVR